tara:strand:+ start:2816 stop:3052 length:237 start_codon:yes stop_codon:yes gene_type:complete
MKKLFSVILVLIISIFIDSQIVNSLEENDAIKENNKIEKSTSNNVKDDSLNSNPNKDDIFGDEQTFPFVAGLGKNAAH